MTARRVFRFLLICLIIFALASYLSYLRTGQFWLPNISTGVTQLSLPLVDSPPSMNPVEAPTEPTYKWRKDGQWHYGDEPPEGVKAISLVKERKEQE